MGSKRLLFKPPNLVYFCYRRETVLSLRVPMIHAWVITMRAFLWPQEWTFRWSNKSRFCWKRITLFFPLGLELWRCKLLLLWQGKFHPRMNQYREEESVQFSCSVMSDSLWPHEPQHARPPCPSPTPRVHPNPCPSSRWCHPTISSSVVPFTSHL